MFRLDFDRKKMYDRLEVRERTCISGRIQGLGAMLFESDIRGRNPAMNVEHRSFSLLGVGGCRGGRKLQAGRYATGVFLLLALAGGCCGERETKRLPVGVKSAEKSVPARTVETSVKPPAALAPVANDETVADTTSIKAEISRIRAEIVANSQKMLEVETRARESNPDLQRLHQEMLGKRNEYNAALLGHPEFAQLKNRHQELAQAHRSLLAKKGRGVQEKE